MKLRYEFVVQEVSDSFIAVAVGADASKFNGIVKMNKTSAFVFDQLKNDVTEDEIVAKMLEKYDAEEKKIRKDVKDFIAKLSEADLLVL